MSTEENTVLLIEAIESGDTVEVHRLLPISDPKSDGSFALVLAVELGDIECVKLLVGVSDVTDALGCAVQANNFECLKLLIPASTPSEKTAEALYWASFKGHTECVDLLCEAYAAQAKDVLITLQSEYEDEPVFWGYLEHKVVQQQRDMLEAEVVSAQEKPTVLKLRKI